ncbi:MAG: DegQ family serine endoprotease [Candidatus Competibacteraceae bacterium]|jgi:serine protease Do|nr:DegQ family serine endoprotease [Candidatus Competibacteraceae bacterium]
MKSITKLALCALYGIVSLHLPSLVVAQELPNFRQLVKDSEASVVNVSSTQGTGADGLRSPGLPGLQDENPLSDFFRRFFDERSEPFRERQTHSLGSGFLISADGYILTNAHVARDADKIVVRLSDHREKPAKLVGVDELTDVALLKIEGEEYPVVKIGDSDTLEVGDWVLAIGSPFGLERTATQGIVSAVGRNLPSDAYVPFIQTDAAINPGNSGGPLFNVQGQVIGINSQIYSSTGGYMGLSFAVPIKLAMQVAEQLKATGEVTRGWLGVMIQNINAELAEAFGLDRARGALVAQLQPESPAARAGFKVGDVILRYGGEPVEESSQLPRMIGATPVGKTIAMSILRNGEPLEIKATIARLEEVEELAAMDEREEAQLNISMAELSNEQRRALSIESQGILITNVGDGPASNAGLYPGDVVLMVNQQEVTSTTQFAEVVQALPRNKALPLLVQRDDEMLFLPLKIPAPKE